MHGYRRPGHFLQRHAPLGKASLMMRVISATFHAVRHVHHRPDGLVINPLMVGEDTSAVPRSVSRSQLRGTEAMVVPAPTRSRRLREAAQVSWPRRAAVALNHRPKNQVATVDAGGQDKRVTSEAALPRGAGVVAGRSLVVSRGYPSFSNPF